MKVKRSFWVKVSALATTGIKLTRVPNRFMTSISKGFKLQRLLARVPLRKYGLNYARMTSGSDEVEACVNTQVGLLRPLRLLLLPHISFVLVVDEFDDG